MTVNQDSSTHSFSAQWLSEAEIPLANKFYRTHKFRGKVRRHDPCAVIRDEQSQIIACGCLRQLTECQLLAGVAVAQNYQGQGVARLLLNNMAEAFEERTFTFPYPHLVPFYRSAGFEEEDKPYSCIKNAHFAAKTPKFTVSNASFRKVSGPR